MPLPRWRTIGHRGGNSRCRVGRALANTAVLTLLSIAARTALSCAGCGSVAMANALRFGAVFMGILPLDQASMTTSPSDDETGNHSVPLSL